MMTRKVAGPVAHRCSNTAFVEYLSNKFNSAVMTATHLRKNDRSKPVDIIQDGDGWFEENMGSSHFMNSHGSMWGLQKSPEEDGTTYFRGGAQRKFGFSQLIPMQLKHNWFEQVDDFLAACEMVLPHGQKKEGMGSASSSIHVRYSG
jgi:hypothetical protein